MMAQLSARIDNSIVKKLLAVFLLLVTTGLNACGEGSGAIVIPMRHWQDMDVRVETHPNPPIAGMSEIVVIVTGPRGRPISDLMISMRSSNGMPWVQTIQDGFIGVYRRALDIGDNENAVLQVQLQRGSERQILLFPLTLVKT